MSEPTLTDIASTLSKVATNTANLVVDMAEVKTDIKDLKGIKDVVNSHTGTLDKILTTTTKFDTERMVETERIKRLENWAVQVGEKLGIKLEV